MVISFFQYAEYEQVVVEDRIEKEKARRKAEQEAEELKSAIHVRQIQILFSSDLLIQFKLENLLLYSVSHGWWLT